MPATMAECHQVIGELRRQLQVQQEQIAKLQEQVGLDSSNSSKPPSSDGPGKNRRERRASGRKRGAQHGHPGAYRALVEEAQVERITDCPVPPQCECGGEVSSQGKPLRHQVFDVPVQVQAEVDEYRIYSGQCQVCGKAARGVLPAGVPRGQIGPRALALVGVLGTQYHLTQQKVRDLLAQVLGVDFSVGAISQAHGLVAQALAAPVQQEYLRIPGAAEYWHELDINLSAVLGGQMTPKDALDATAAAWEKITDRYGREEQKKLYAASFA